MALYLNVSPLSHHLPVTCPGKQYGSQNHGYFHCEKTRTNILTLYERSQFKSELSCRNQNNVIVREVQ